MYQTYTVSGTRSSTYSEARARSVMDKVLDDIVGLFARGFITKQRAIGWYWDLLYILSKEAAEFFELQFSTPGGSRVGLRYGVTDDGQVYEDSDSGGLDYFALPDGTTVNLFVELRGCLKSLQQPNYNVPQKLDHPIRLDQGPWGERNDDDATAAA